MARAKYTLPRDPSKYHRKWYSPLPGQRSRREGGQKNYPDDLLQLIEVDEKSGCWVWHGTIHASGAPIFKGWLYAKRVIFEMFCGKLEVKQSLLKIKTCTDTRCVNPWHHRICWKGQSVNDERKAGWIPPPLREKDSAPVQINDLEFLEQIARIGEGLMLLNLPFTSAQALVKAGFIQLVPFEEGKVKLRLTPRGLAMVETRKRIRNREEK